MKEYLHPKDMTNSFRATTMDSFRKDVVQYIVGFGGGGIFFFSHWKDIYKQMIKLGKWENISEERYKDYLSYNDGSRFGQWRIHFHNDYVYLT